MTIFAGTGTSAHRFYVESGGAEYDVLDVAESAVRTWRGFLTQHDLI